MARIARVHARLVHTTGHNGKTPISIKYMPIEADVANDMPNRSFAIYETNPNIPKGSTTPWTREPTRDAQAAQNTGIVSRNSQNAAFPIFPFRRHRDYRRGLIIIDAPEEEWDEKGVIFVEFDRIERPRAEDDMVSEVYVRRVGGREDIMARGFDDLKTTDHMGFAMHVWMTAWLSEPYMPDCGDEWDDESWREREVEEDKF
ncbi:hypothetical protein VTN00DRAFT_6320 [Thermoascus crustaceus]|uniref:uncharacterized protein n=1 Tax=Thermoascus crustaceus TaxID=5088 RepID=UPI00374204D5